VKKITLTFEPDFEFQLLALVSPLRGFKLCWVLENKLNLRLFKSDDLHLSSKRGKVNSYFQVFESEEQEEIQETYTLFGNKTSNGFLIPEQKVVDYYLKIEGDMSASNFRKLADRLAALSEIQHQFEVDPESLKSKQNFIL